MPTYEYQCKKCEAVFEAFQSMTDPPLNECRECGAVGTVSRLIGAGAGLIFKGSGFYETDYKRAAASSKSPHTADKDKPKPEPKSDKKDETKSKSDSKPSSKKD